MDVIYNAGPLVAVLFFVSILTVAFSIERFWALNVAAGKKPFSRIWPELKSKIEARDFDGAMAVADSQMGSVGRALAAGIVRYRALTGRITERGLRNELDLSIRENNVMEGALLERNIIPLATIGSIANLIGLLGTVIGMIQSFAAISAKGEAEKVAATKLAAGIATALVNAAGGLIVAIMAVIFYNYFLSRIDRINFAIEESTNLLLEELIISERKVKS